MQRKSIKYIFGLLLIGLLIYLVDVGKLWEALRHITWEIAFYLGIISVFLIYISALKWKFFCDAFGKVSSLIRLFNLYLVGYFINLLIPSYVGGDAVRSWYVGKRIGQHQAFAATILERYTGFVAMLALAFVFMWGVELVTVEIKIAVLLLTAGLGVITWLALSPRAFVWCSRIRALRKILGHIEKVQEAFQLVRKNRGLLLKTMALSFCFHTVTVLNTMAAAYAVGWFTPSPSEIFVVLPLILLIGAIPVAPSGLGIQEGAFLYFLSGIGATPEQALGVGIVLRVKSYMLAVIGGFIWLGLRGERKNKALQEPTLLQGEKIH